MKLNDITIKVHRFGPLEKVSFKLAPMMLFTGMSSSGKSYANYLVYYFLYMVCNGNLRDFVKDKISKSDEVQSHVFDLDVFLKDLADNVEGFMRKFLGDDEMVCKVEFKSLKRKRTLSFEVKKVENSVVTDKERDDVELPPAPQPYELVFNGGPRETWPSIEYVKYFVARELQIFVLGNYISRAVILPPGRGAFVGENFSIKTEVGSSMNMYNNYFHDYDFGLSERIKLKMIDEDYLSDKLLKITSGGHLVSIEGKQFIQFDEKHKIALSAGASSIKDLSPWLFYLKNHMLAPFSFCLEEPEAHQHPSTTVQIADVMAMATHQYRSIIFHLTTHSDYLIQRLNQLIKLGSIRRKSIEAFRQICKERHLDVRGYLDAKDIHAYYFSKNAKGKTVVETMKVTDEGIPMKSFFDVVRDLDEREDYINAAIYRLSKKEV